MDNVTSYIESVDDNLKPVVLKLRKILVEASPNIKEEIKWGVPTYSLNKNICSIMAHKNHVNLQIFRGADIKDSHYLDGTGKSMRHLKFKQQGEMNIDVINKIIAQAIKIDQRS